jgi:DNA gyrase subunit B
MPPKTNKKAVSGEYSAKNITVLEGLEPVRKRPGMYIGSTGPAGLHHLIWEVVDNSFDEAMAGHASKITVHVQPDNWIAVEDDGRGIPVDIHPEQKISALELVLTKLHAGGKFGGDASGYKVSGGLHGVGVSVVNALSDHLQAEVHRDGKIWVQEFKKGIPQGRVKAIGPTKKRGTIIRFHADATIFETIEYDFNHIIDHLRQQGYLTAGIHVEIIDERTDEHKPYGFYFEGGVASFVRHLNERRETKQPNVFYVHKAADVLDVEVALQYTAEYHESMHCYANNIVNAEGGTHLVGFRAALTRVLNSYARDKGYLKEKDINLTGEDTREGLTAVISVKLPEPQFEGQTKGKLGNPNLPGRTPPRCRGNYRQMFAVRPRPRCCPGCP